MSDYEPPPLSGHQRLPVTVERLVCPKCGYECRPEELNPAFGRACPECLRQAARFRLPKMVSLPITIRADAIDSEPLMPTTVVVVKAS
jgi:hypothetical protein